MRYLLNITTYRTSLEVTVMLVRVTGKGESWIVSLEKTVDLCF